MSRKDTQYDEIDQDCPTCGAGPSFQDYLWKDPDGAKRGDSPDRIGCEECLVLRPVDTGTDRPDIVPVERDEVPDDKGFRFTLEGCLRNTKDDE